MVITETLKIEQSHHTPVARSCGSAYTCFQGLGIIVLCIEGCEKNWQLHLCILQPRVIFFATYGLCLCLWKLCSWVLPASLNIRFLTDMIKLGQWFPWDFTNLTLMRLGQGAVICCCLVWFNFLPEFCLISRKGVMGLVNNYLDSITPTFDVFR